MKKRWCVALLAMLMAFTLSGCGASSKGFNDSAAADVAAPQASPDAKFEVTEEAVSGDNALDGAVSTDEAPVPAESEDTEV